jgi:hypothetical protein
MGGRCNNCNHLSCGNGERGVSVWRHCELCDDFIQLCSNNMKNGDACGCGDKEDILCENCLRN